MGVTVAITGPTGEIGISAVTALESDDRVERIIGMARRPFDPTDHGWTKTEYRQGDILDREAVDGLVRDADVVVHLAFIVLGSRDEAARVNLAGTTTVFEATIAAERPTRIVYTSSVAAYGYHDDNPLPLTEDTPIRGSAEHYYSAQKAECELAIADLVEGTDLEVYTLRPCIVAGPKSPALAESMPWNMLPGPAKALLNAVPGLRMPFPDHGVPVQLVHHDDVAEAIAICAVADAPAGAYNIAGDGTVSLGEIVERLGGQPVPFPAIGVKAAAEVVKRMPFLPSFAEWIHIGRTSVVMDTAHARDELGWTPKHTARETLDELAASRS